MTAQRERIEVARLGDNRVKAALYEENHPVRGVREDMVRIRAREALDRREKQ